MPPETTLHNRCIFVLLGMIWKESCGPFAHGWRSMIPSANNADVSQHH
jgi:hypothetical protein